MATTSGFPSAPSAASSSPKGAASSSGSSGAQNSTAKRLTSELMQLMMSPPGDGVSAFPKDESDLSEWVGRVKGAEDTPYDGLEYSIALTFPASYPYKPPVIKFTSKIYHPNVDMHGNICLDILKEKWAPTLSVSTILISLQSLLGDPNNASPLNLEASELWANQEAFKREVQRHYTPLDAE